MIELIGKLKTWETSDDMLGHGGNGIVYPLTEDDKVVKVFKANESDPKLEFRKERFAHEILFVRDHSCKNPHMPVFYDENRYGQPLFFIMKKYNDVRWLYDNCNKKCFYTSVLQACLQLIEAIDYVHGTGTAHRDIKPKNLLFEVNDAQNDYTLILSDYGLMCNEGVHSPGDSLGSYTFTPPELNDRKIGENTDRYFSSDVYEFAKTVYALLNRNEQSFPDSVKKILQEYEIEVRDETASLALEPIYEMIEKSICDNQNERIKLDKCKEYIQMSLSLFENEIPSEWIERRNERRGFNKCTVGSAPAIIDQSMIKEFVDSLVNKKYDLIEPSGKTYSLNSIVSVYTSGIQYAGSNINVLYKASYNDGVGTSTLQFYIESLTVPNGATDRLGASIAIQGNSRSSDKNTPTTFVKYFFVKKQASAQKVVVNTTFNKPSLVMPKKKNK